MCTTVGALGSPADIFDIRPENAASAKDRRSAGCPWRSVFRVRRVSAGGNRRSVRPQA